MKTPGWTVDAETNARVREDEFCTAVGSRLKGAAVSMHPRVSEAVGELVSHPGKRLRPRILADASGWPAHWTDDHVALGVVVELIHVGSLLHDDVIDRASHRRGFPSAFASLGPELAVLAGASCFATAGNMISGFGPEFVRVVATTMDQLADGELRDVERAFDLTLDEDRYVAMVSAKTGALFGLCCRLGAMIAERGRASEDAYGRFGTSFGAAFQVLDDCLDFATGDVGKPVGTDVRLGLFGLPVLFAVNSLSDSSAAAELTALLSSESWKDQTYERLRDLVHSSDGLQLAFRTADRVLRSATQEFLENQQDSPARQLAHSVEAIYWTYRHDVA